MAPSTFSKWIISSSFISIIEFTTKKKKNSKKDHLNRRRIVFSPYRRRTLSELTYATGRKKERDGNLNV